MLIWLVRWSNFYSQVNLFSLISGVITLSCEDVEDLTESQKSTVSPETPKGSPQNRLTVAQISENEQKYLCDIEELEALVSPFNLPPEKLRNLQDAVAAVKSKKNIKKESRKSSGYDFFEAIISIYGFTRDKDDWKKLNAIEYKSATKLYSALLKSTYIYF